MSMIKMQKLALIVSILMMASMVSAAPSDLPKASQAPGDTFYFLDRFSDSLELAVAKAPIIGSPELEAKVRANHAAERLAEARKLAEQNRSDQVDKLMEEYIKQANLSAVSAKKANNTNLSKRLQNVSNNHVKVLQDVQRKVPEQAQKGIQNAIENSQKNQRELDIPDIAQKRGKPRKDSDSAESSDKLAETSAIPPVSNLAQKRYAEKSNTTTPEDVIERTQRLTEELKKTMPNQTNHSAQNLSATQKLEEAEETVNETEKTVEETVEDDSKITGQAVGEAIGKPSKSGLP